VVNAVYEIDVVDGRHDVQINVMFVGGPNERLDFHLEEGEEVYTVRYVTLVRHCSDCTVSGSASASFLRMARPEAVVDPGGRIRPCPPPAIHGI